MNNRLARSGRMLFNYPLVVLKPGRELVELVVEVHEDSVAEVFRSVGDGLVSSCVLPHPHRDDYRVLQMFIPAEAVEDVKRALESLPVGEVLTFTSTAMRRGWGG